MRFALLGESEELIDLARAASQAGHQLAACCDCPSRGSRLRDLAPSASYDVPWESLLHHPGYQAVLVDGDGPPQRAEQLRKLVQAGSPLMIVHPVFDSLLAFELDMIRQDNHCLVLPYHVSNGPGLSQLAEFVQQGAASPIGQAEQLLFHRAMNQRDRAAVTKQLARDASLIRGVLGDIRRVSAMGTLDEDQHANLSVNLGGGGPCFARWSVGPVIDREEGRLSLTGSQGSATLCLPADRRADVSLEFQGLASPAPRIYSPEAAAQSAIEQLEAQIASGQGNRAWLQACLDLEVAESIPDALRRGRTIELYQEQRTESGSFKGVMAMGSCGLILFAFLVLLVVVLAEGLRLPFRHSMIWKAWPLFLIAPLAFFLLLQLLQLFVPQRESAEPDDPPKKA